MEKAYQTRHVDGKLWIVPNTGHWANWHDNDAIRHHGVVWPTSDLTSAHLDRCNDWDSVVAVVEQAAEHHDACDGFADIYEAVAQYGGNTAAAEGVYADHFAAREQFYHDLMN